MLKATFKLITTHLISGVLLDTLGSISADALITLKAIPDNVDEIISKIPQDSSGGVVIQNLLKSKGVLSVEEEVSFFDFDAILGVVLLVARYKGGIEMEMDTIEGAHIEVNTLIKYKFAIVYVKNDSIVERIYIVPHYDAAIDDVRMELVYDGKEIVKLLLQSKDKDFKIFTVWLDEDLDDPDSFNFGATIEKIVKVFDKDVILHMKLNGKITFIERTFRPHTPLKGYDFQVQVLSVLMPRLKAKLIKAS
jgi:hypothetical protein